MNSIGGYRVLGEIARGGMGVVYRVQDSSGQIFALKVLLEVDSQGAERFHREADLAGRLDHPHVVRVRGHGVTNGHPYLVMDYIEGEDLWSRLRRDGPLPEPEARRMFSALGEGLRSAHALGIVHRDLKPQNILLRGDEVYLADFGLARQGPSRLTLTGELLGTPSYMAPEQARGQRDQIQPATDVYGLGATLYAALCGIPPHQGASALQTLNLVVSSDPPSLRARRSLPLSPQLEELVSSCLRRDPAERPDLQEVLACLATPVAASRTPILLAALVLLCACLALVLASLGPGEEPLASPQPSQDVEAASALSLTEEALALLRARRPLEASEALKRAFALDPACDAAHVAQAEIDFNLNRWETSLACPERLSEGASAALRASAYYFRGRALQRTWLYVPGADEGLLSEALTAYERSLALVPSSRAYTCKGFTFLSLRDRSGAKQALEEARRLTSRRDPHVQVLQIALDPDDTSLPVFQAASVEEADLTYELALVLAGHYLMANDEERAAEAVQLALAMRPNEQVMYLARQADAIYRRSMAKPAENQAGIKEDCARSLGLLSAALSNLDAQGSRLHARLLRGRALLHLHQGNLVAALADRRALLDINPQDPQVRLDLAETIHATLPRLFQLWHLEAIQIALAEAKPLVREGPNWQRSHQLALEGRAAALQADFATAERAFAAGFKLLSPPEEGASAMSSGELSVWVGCKNLRARSRIEAQTLGYPTPPASTDLREVLALVPGHEHSEAWLVHALFAEGELEQGLELAAQVRAKLPERHVLYPLVEIFRIGNKGPAARRTLLNLLHVEPWNPRFLAKFMTVDPEAAVIMIQEAPKVVRSHPSLVIAIAAQSQVQGSLGPAEELLEGLQAQFPKCAAVRVELALLRASQGRYGEALAALEELVKEAQNQRIRTWLQQRILKVKARRDQSQ